MERFDFGLQKENTHSQLCGGSKHHLTFLRKVLLDRVLPFLPQSLIDQIKLMPRLLGWKMLLQASLLDATIGTEWVHPTLDTTALQCKPCKFKADPQNSQYVHLEIF